MRVYHSATSAFLTFNPRIVPCQSPKRSIIAIVMSQDVLIQKARSWRRISLRLSPDGQVVVRAPFWMSKSQIDQFVQTNQPWIVKNQAKLSQRHSLMTPDWVQIFGQKYPRLISTDPNIPLGIHIVDQNLVFRPADSLNWTGSDRSSVPPQLLTKADSALTRFLQQAASSYITTKTHQLADQMGIKFASLRFKQQTTRWGSCSSSGNLNFNWRLVHFLPEVIEYVIIHELAHRQEMNHSVKFWRLVARFDPQYKQHKKVLKTASLD